MGNQKQKEKKKKEREKIVKVKVAKRREVIREQRKMDKEETLREQEAHDIMHGRSMPIINDPNVLAQMEARKAKEVSDQLKKNLQILEALEAEYETEQARRDEVHVKLESEGHKTMREKMDALHEKALALTNKAKEFAEAKEEYAEQLKDDPSFMEDVTEELKESVESDYRKILKKND